MYLRLFELQIEDQVIREIKKESLKNGWEKSADRVKAYNICLVLKAVPLKLYRDLQLLLIKIDWLRKMIHDELAQVIINALKLAKNYYQYDTTIKQPRLSFHLVVLIYTFYKKYPKKLLTTTSTDSGASMTRATIKFFLASYTGFSAGTLLPRY